MPALPGPGVAAIAGLPVRMSPTALPVDPDDLLFRRMDAAGGDRRDDAGSVAGQDDALPAPLGFRIGTSAADMSESCLVWLSLIVVRPSSV